MSATENIEITVKTLLATLPTEARARLIKEYAELEPTPQDRLISRIEAARMLGRSPRCISYLAKNGILPGVTFPGHRVAAGYRLSDVQALIGRKAS